MNRAGDIVKRLGEVRAGFIGGWVMNWGLLGTYVCLLSLSVGVRILLDEDGRCVLVIDDGSALQWVREGCVHHSDRWWHVAAREYFKKHPEPKPWHSAKDQQWWKVKHENVGLEFACVIESNGELEFVFVNGLGVAITSPCIENAELVK